ncbi:MAG: anti-sigma factor [Leptolyngbyaceae cyanobacterium SM1_3_5]|nr:anti-sigma factor [Leptolyngbyaceae cyanobacterium SM1_3_5]
MNAENRCFAELAPLYVLDALDEIDRRWVEMQVAANPELAAELAEYETTVAALSYSAPLLPIADSLKDRLFDRLGFDRSNNETSQPNTLSYHFPDSLLGDLSNNLTAETELEWQPFSLPGVSMAVLHIDEEKREISCLLRAEPGAKHPLHRHAGIEEILVLEGSLEMDDKRYGKYGYIRSEPHSTHTLLSPQGCVCFLRTSLDNEEGLEEA